MTKNLKDKGWNSMRTLLDEEMPVKRNRPYFLVFLIIGLFLAGAIVGWYGRDWTKSEVIPVLNVNSLDEDATRLLTEKEKVPPTTNKFIEIDRPKDIEVSETRKEIRSKANSNSSFTNEKAFIPIASQEDYPHSIIVENTHSSQQLNDDFAESDRHSQDEVFEDKTLSSNQIKALVYIVKYNPVPLLESNIVKQPLDMNSRTGIELNADIAYVFNAYKPSLGFQANVVFNASNRFKVIAGGGYRHYSLGRDYSFRNNGEFIDESEVQLLTKATVFYIDELSQWHVSAGMGYDLNKFVTLRGSLLPTYNRLSGVFLGDHPRLADSDGRYTYFSIDYSIGTRVRISRRFGFILNYQANLSPYTNVDPDQGRGHNYHQRLGVGLSYMIK